MLEKPPELTELVGEGPIGATWKVRLPDGRGGLAREVRLPDPAALEAAADRLRRVERLNDPALAPVRGWWSQPGAVWYATDQEQGEALAEMLKTGPLSPQGAAAASLGVLSGLVALHAEGLSHGALLAENVRILPDGRVRLDGHQLSTLRFPTDGELAAELRTAGRLICDTFGIPLERDPQAPPKAIEHAAPGLVVTARSIAFGNLGRDIELARTGLRDTAGPLAAPERLALGVEQLADMVARRRSGSTIQPEPRYRGLGAGAGAPAMPERRLPTSTAPAGPPPPVPPSPVPPRPAYQPPQPAQPSQPPPAPQAPPPAPAPAPRPAYQPPQPPLPAPAPTPAAPPRPSYQPPQPPPQPPASAPPPAATAPAPRSAQPSRPAYPPTYQPVRPSMPGVIGEDREPILAGRTRLIAGAVALLLIFALGAGGVWAARGLLAQPTTTAVNSPSPAQPTPATGSSPVPTRSPGPAALPNLGPAAAGIITGVDVKPDGACDVGGGCRLQVDIHMKPQPADHDVSWAFKIFDRCTSGLTDAPGSTFTSKGPWNLLSVSSTLTLPASRGQLAVYALTTSPSTAYTASPLLLGNEAGC